MNYPVAGNLVFRIIGLKKMTSKTSTQFKKSEYDKFGPQHDKETSSTMDKVPWTP